MKLANQSIEPTGGSQLRPSPFVGQWRLPPVAHARRSMTIYSNAIFQTLVTCALIITGRSAFAIGGEYPPGRPIIDTTNWPSGLAKLIDVTNRVHGYCVNAEDIFAFSGDASQLTTFLSDLSRLDKVKGLRLILRDGVGQTKAPWGEKGGRPCDWELYACPKGWHNLILLERSGGFGTNSVEALREIGSEPGYYLEVRFWTGGHIALDQVHVPGAFEVSGKK